MGLKDKVRRLEQLAEGRLVSVELEDGSVIRFDPDLIVECFSNVMQRIRADEDEPTPERHSFIDTLARVRDKESFERDYGNWVGLIVAEDEVLRGLRERRGPPVREPL
jgi:hypothetical protein